MDKDKNGYPIGIIKHSDLIHRQIAYSEIYLKSRNKYPKKFGEYIVHHIDTNIGNFSVSNLYLCTKEEHNAIHTEQKRRLQKFTNPSEIDSFLNTWRKEKQNSLSNLEDKEKREEEFRKIDELNHIDIEKENKKKRKNINKEKIHYHNKAYSWEKHLKELKKFEEETKNNDKKKKKLNKIKREKKSKKNTINWAKIIKHLISWVIPLILSIISYNSTNNETQLFFFVLALFWWIISFFVWITLLELE